jgi:hypothetical protein
MTPSPSRMTTEAIPEMTNPAASTEDGVPRITPREDRFLADLIRRREESALTGTQTAEFDPDAPLRRIASIIKRLSTGELQLSDPRKQVVVSREDLEAFAARAECEPAYQTAIDALGLVRRWLSPGESR